MEIKSVHICLEVADYKKSLEFYGPLFKAAKFAVSWTDEKSYGGYTNGTTTIFIGEAKPRRVVRKRPTGEEFVVVDHVGFSVGDRADVDAIAAAMAAAGVTPLFRAREYPEFGPGFYAVTFCDADNNVIEFGHRSQPTR
ncbi:MAG: VOC family protein [Deltaproteobacteria bacterium]|nr:VOC family protein [Deltaproteobacteria bacterium]